MTSLHPLPLLSPPVRLFGVVFAFVVGVFAAVFSAVVGEADAATAAACLRRSVVALVLLLTRCAGAGVGVGIGDRVTTTHCPPLLTSC